MVGHSSGEIAAAYASGAISRNEAIFIAYYRGLVVQTATATVSPGGMAAVGLGSQAVSEFLQPEVVVGCENSPNSVTLSGAKVVLERVLTDIKEAHPDTLVRILQVDQAYHSRKCARYSIVETSSIIAIPPESH